MGRRSPAPWSKFSGRNGREPNRPATTLELREGLEVESQNRWPSLRFDALAVSDLFARFLPAGFYYKTFMAPGRFWELLYEPLLRHAAGLGRLRAGTGTARAPAETVHDHLDVLVVGAGAAGLAAAQRLGLRGLRVMLVDEDAVLGGGSLLDDRWSVWREAACKALGMMPSVRCLTRTTVIGAYGHGVYGALQTLTPAEAARAGGLCERLRVVRARATILATGAIERLIAFPGNDVPGVMLAGAAHKFLRRYGVAVGRRPVFFLNTDEGYEAVYAYAAAGIASRAVIDVRAASPGAERARALGIEVITGATVEAVRGRGAVRSVRVAHRDGRAARKLEADCLLMSGGYTPNISLASQLRADLQWREEIAAFVAALPPGTAQVAGAARGVFGLAAAARDGELAARNVAALLGTELSGAAADSPPLPPDPNHALISAVWEVPGRGKSFVDLQNDVTSEDVRLAAREGYEHVEHMKRYTTHGMATDQGRIGGLVGSAILAHARGLKRGRGRAGQAAAVPAIRYRLPHWRAQRRARTSSPSDACRCTIGTKPRAPPLRTSACGCGRWCTRSSRAGNPCSGKRARCALRSASPICRHWARSTCREAARVSFLILCMRIRFPRLRIGGARYGIMLREDGMLLDDGTTSRLGAEHFLITTTTANSSVVLEHLEFHLQAVCPELEVLLTDVSDQWAQFAVAGPRSREVVAAVVSGLDLSNEAFPFMSAAAAQVAGIAGRVYRISFSGELAYELAVPAQYARVAWSALLEAGTRYGIVPYGLDALNTLRIEKGHVTGAELNGNTSADDLGMYRLLKKHGDFVGRALSQRPGL